MLNNINKIVLPKQFCEMQPVRNFRFFSDVVILPKHFINQSAVAQGLFFIVDKHKNLTIIKYLFVIDKWKLLLF